MTAPDPFEVVFQIGSLIWDFAHTAAGLCFFAVVLAMALTTAIPHYLLPSIRFRFRELSPVIGYKKAHVKNIVFANGDTEIKDIEFSGVYTGRYNAKDVSFSFNSFTRHSPGFHMYNTYKNACAHAQGSPSAVILEVLGCDKMIELEEGSITSEQRVLQVIVTCRSEHCKDTPRYCLIPRNPYADYNFACSKHSKDKDKDERRISLLPLLNKTHYVPANETWYETGEQAPLVIGVGAGKGNIQPFTPTHLSQ